MRATKLLGALFLVMGLFIFTRGTTWHIGYMILGAGVGLLGCALLIRRNVGRRLQVKPIGPRFGTRTGRVRVASTWDSK